MSVFKMNMERRLEKIEGLSYPFLLYGSGSFVTVLRDALVILNQHFNDDNVNDFKIQYNLVDSIIKNRERFDVRHENLIYEKQNRTKTYTEIIEDLRNDTDISIKKLSKKVISLENKFKNMNKLKEISEDPLETEIEETKVEETKNVEMEVEETGIEETEVVNDKLPLEPIMSNSMKNKLDDWKKPEEKLKKIRKIKKADMTPEERKSFNDNSAKVTLKNRNTIDKKGIVIPDNPYGYKFVEFIGDGVKCVKCGKEARVNYIDPSEKHYEFVKAYRCRMCEKTTVINPYNVIITGKSIEAYNYFNSEILPDLKRLGLVSTIST